MAKKKRTFTSVELVQKQFSRRIARGVHIGIFLASQAAIWLWWLAESARTGRGFSANFFADRLIVLVVWSMLLLTHIWITRLLNERDAQIADMLESGNFAGDADEAIEAPRTVVYARLAEKYDDAESRLVEDEEPSRNSNHR
jgi:hypothetical protein